MEASIRHKVIKLLINISKLNKFNRDLVLVSKYKVGIITPKILTYHF